MIDSNFQKEQIADDFFDTVVPLGERKSDITMGLLWITMMTSFPMVILGFEWFKAGFTIHQVIVCALLGAFGFFLFTFCSSWMGLCSGLSYSVLCRHIFGLRGSQIVSLVWSGLFLLWYALNAVLFSDAIKGLFNLSWSIPVIAVVLTVVMAFNTAFGFRGVANFARYVAAPILIIWIAATFFKAAGATTLASFNTPSHVPWTHALAVISSMIIGVQLWGNEADFWRFGKSSFSATGLWIMVAIIIGEIIFPLTGWLMASVSGITDAAAGTKFLNDYSFGGNAWIAALVLGVSYFALNDGNLYGAVNGLENIWVHHRRLILLGAIIFSAVVAVMLVPFTNALDAIASLNAFILPCVTLIIAFEYFAAPKIWPNDPHNHPDYRANFYLPGTAALIIGWMIGLLTSGIFPQCEAFHVGIWPLYAWGTSVIVFVTLRMAAHRKLLRLNELGFDIKREAEPELVASIAERN